MTTISDLKVGDRATVASYSELSKPYRRKLLSMGLTPGVEIGVTRVAPMGDPVEIRVRGFSLSLRKEEASTLNVEVL
jgi:ferrous iron transport protein A